MSETTYIDEADVHQCNNCGAYAKTADTIKHHSTCKPGEAKKWEQFYEEEGLRAEMEDEDF